MGCGKSTVSKLFQKRGFGVVDADRLVHELLASDEPTIAEVAGRFGSDLLLAEGGICRVRLGQRVFGDAEKLAALEAILHPKVRERWEMRANSGGDWVVEIPLLFEKKLQNRVDFTVCVTCHPDVQSKRLEERGLDPAQAKARLDRQMPLADKVALADYVLLNDGTLDALERQIDRLVAELKKPH